MSVETDFRATLAAYSALTTLVGTRLALSAAPEGAAVPLVVYACTHDRTIGLGGALLADRCTIDVQCWANTAVQADAVADAVVAAVATAATASGACVLDRSNTFDAELGLDGVVLTVEWWA
jgi:hypothetical protein